MSRENWPDQNPPYPDHDCPACERGERTTTPPVSSVVGSAPVHTPSGNVCMKHVDPGMFQLLQQIGKRPKGCARQDLLTRSRPADTAVRVQVRDQERRGAAVLFIAAGWDYTHKLTPQDGICDDGSCFRCRLTALLVEATQKEDLEASAEPERAEVDIALARQHHAAQQEQQFIEEKDARGRKWRDAGSHDGEEHH